MLFVYIDLIERILRYLRKFADKEPVPQPPPTTPSPEPSAAQPPSSPNAPSAAFAQDFAIALKNLRADFPLDAAVDSVQNAKDHELERFVTALAKSKRNKGTRVSGKIYRNNGRILVYGPVWLTNVLWGEVFDQFHEEYEIYKEGG